MGALFAQADSIPKEETEKRLILISDTGEGESRFLEYAYGQTCAMRHLKDPSEISLKGGERFLLHYNFVLTLGGLHTVYSREFWVKSETIIFKYLDVDSNSTYVELPKKQCDCCAWGGSQRFCYRAVRWVDSNGITLKISHEHHPKDAGNMPYDCKLLDTLFLGFMKMVYPTNKYECAPDRAGQDWELWPCGEN